MADDNTTKPGVEGCSWRLVGHWDPALVAKWIEGERLRNTPVPIMAKALGDVMAAAAMGYAKNMDDVQAALLDSDGIVEAFQEALQARVNQHAGGLTPAGIFIPRKH